MAKPGVTTKKKGPSKHSREARRATSPGIDIDKSLKDAKPPSQKSRHQPSVLAIHHGAGVTKKTKRGRNQSTRAKKRAEKSQDKAAAIMERTESKVARSKGQARSIQARAKAWDEVNAHIDTPTSNAFGELEPEEDKDVEEVSDFDDDVGELGAENSMTVEASKVPLPSADDDMDEIL